MTSPNFKGGFMGLVFDENNPYEVGTFATNNGIYNGRIYAWTNLDPSALYYTVIDTRTKGSISLGTFQYTPTTMFIIGNCAYFLKYDHGYEGTLHLFGINGYISKYNIDTASFEYRDKILTASTTELSSGELLYQVRLIINIVDKTINFITYSKSSANARVKIYYFTLYLENGAVGNKNLTEQGQYDVYFRILGSTISIDYGTGRIYSSYYTDFIYGEMAVSNHYAFCYMVKGGINTPVTVQSSYGQTFIANFPCIDTYNNVYAFGGTINPNSIFVLNKINNTVSRIVYLQAASTPQGLPTYTNINDPDTTYSIISSTSMSVNLYNISYFDNVYTFRNNTGSTVYKRIYNAPPIDSIRTTYIGDVITIDIKYTFFDKEYLLTTNYSRTPQEGKVYTGLATTEDATVPKYKVGKYLPFYMQGRQEIDFYEVWQEGDGIDLYKYSGESNRLDKNNYLTPIVSVKGFFRDEVSIINPVIRIEYEGVFDINYIYIPKFKRYYFIDDVVSVRTNMWEISCSVDVLMSYSSSIRNMTAFIDRNEFEYNEMIPDDNRIFTPEVTEDFVDITDDTTIFRNNFDITGNQISNCCYILNGYSLSVSV